MIEFLLRRTAFAVIVVIAVSFLVFSMSRMIPASPALLVLGADANQAAVDAFEAKYGLDKPVVEQYGNWLYGVAAHFDFGVSYVSGRPISAEVAETLPVTIELVLVSMVMCLIVSVPLGVLSAFNPGTVVDHILRIVSVMGVSMPGFWLGLVLIMTLSVWANWFPPGDLPPLSDGIGPHLRGLILPCFCLAVYYTGIISRVTRSSVLDVLNQDYVRTAVSMGLRKSRIRAVYVLRNAMIPLVSVVAMSCGYMFGWAIVIEQVFNIPGISRALLAAIFSRDYNLVQAAVLVVTTAFVSLNLLADVGYRLLDPRI